MEQSAHLNPQCSTEKFCSDWKEALRIEPIEDAEISAEVVAHIENSESFQSLVFGWLVEDTRGVQLFTDDTEKTFGAFCVLFKENRKCLAEVSISQKCAEEMFSVELVSNAVSVPYCVEKREAWMAKREKRHSPRFDANLSGDVVDESTAFEIALSYSLTMEGLTSIEVLSGIHREHIDDSDETGTLADKRIVAAHYLYRENPEAAKKAGKGTAIGWGESYYLLY